MKYLIRISKLNKYYDDSHILKNIDIKIEKGSKYGIIGRSGSGKSTLLRCINGLEKYQSGSITVDGVEVELLNKEELNQLRRDIGMIFQNFSLLERLDVFENIALPLRCWKYDENYIKVKVNNLLEMIGLTDKIHHKPRELSGGQKQRVAIARALSLEPKVLLCDEATSALDPKTTQDTIELLDSINKELKITLIIVTHEMSVLKNICEYASIIENGVVSAEGHIDEIFRNKPDALKNLLANNQVAIPNSGITFEVFFDEKNGDNPIISQISRKLDTDCLIIGGDLDMFRRKQLGSLIFNVPEMKKGDVIDLLDDNNFIWEIL